MITEEQRAALAKLATVLPASFYLAGGTGLAAHLGHRRSLGLDLFSIDDPTPLIPALDRLAGVTVTSRAQGTLYLSVDQVPVSLIQYRYPMLAPTARVDELAVEVASIDDLASMKLSAIAGRGAARDFWDLHTLITILGRTLGEYLGAFGRKYPTHDAGHVLRSLAYFGDADAAPLPVGLTPERWAEIKRDFEAWAVVLIR